jgi:Ca2+-binding EF-hand superfamily protein
MRKCDGIAFAALAGAMTLAGVGEAVAQATPGQGMGRGGGMGMLDRIEMIDADGDGSLTRAELVDWRATVFDAMDADADDRLTREEFVAVQLGRGADPAMRGPRYQQMQSAKEAEFDAMDADRDGFVTRETFEEHAVAMFGEADADGDGRLAPAEFAAMRHLR